MGIHSSAARFLMATAQAGSMARVLTLGRQHMHVTASDLHTLFAEAGMPFSPAACEDLLRERFAEAFLRQLGARVTDAVDVSAYEGANQLWDLNAEVPAAWDERYDVVVDGGALEHIFHLPNALKSCMRMVAVGGALVLVAPANNFCGHGFYQFSPELFFRALSDANGFAVEDMVLVESEPNGKTRLDAPWYRVDDPDTVRGRVELINQRPAYLLVRARRHRAVPIFAQAPQQSDYVALWSDGEKKPPSSSSPSLSAKNAVAHLAQKVVPERWLREALHLRRITKRFDKPYFHERPPRKESP